MVTIEKREKLVEFCYLFLMTVRANNYSPVNKSYQLMANFLLLLLPF